MPSENLSSPPVSAGAFTLSSPAFADGQVIPQRHGCSGEDISPELRWSGSPEGTAQLALIVDDPDAGGFLHWLLVGISGSTDGTIEEGRGDASAYPDVQGRNDFDRIGWGGPCPPRRHTYVFTLYALSEAIEPGREPAVDAVRTAMEGRVIGEARLTGTYEQTR